MIDELEQVWASSQPLPVKLPCAKQQAVQSNGRKNKSPLFPYPFPVATWPRTVTPSSTAEAWHCAELLIKEHLLTPTSRIQWKYMTCNCRTPCPMLHLYCTQPTWVRPFQEADLMILKSNLKWTSEPRTVEQTGSAIRGIYIKQPKKHRNITPPWIRYWNQIFFLMADLCQLHVNWTDDESLS